MRCIIFAPLRTVLLRTGIKAAAVDIEYQILFLTLIKSFGNVEIIKMSLCVLVWQISVNLTNAIVPFHRYQFVRGISR